MTTPNTPVEGVPGLHSINHDQRLFVLPAGGGFSCLGFDVAYRETREAAKITRRADLEPPEDRGEPSDRGTVEGFQRYRSAMDALNAYYRQRPDLTHFAAGTPREVQSALDYARTHGPRVRIFCGDPETGEAWAEENDVCGWIGRSMGPQKAPLLIEKRRDSGGGAILTASIVAIFQTDGRELYRHPKFTVGTWEARGVEVFHNGALYGREKTAEKAQRLADFMGARRFVP